MSNTQTMDFNRYVQFWLVGDWESGELVSVRGQSTETDDRYEFSQDDGVWSASVVVDMAAGDWGFMRVASGTLFECMVAVEKHAKACAESGDQ